MPGRKSFLFCSVPCRMIIGAIDVTVRSGPGTPAYSNSLISRCWCIAVRPRPPFSVGQFSPNQPFSPILRRNAVSSPPWYSSPCSAISALSAGVTFSARNCRTSATHARWASSSSKSTQATLSRSCLPGGRTVSAPLHRIFRCELGNSSTQRAGLSVADGRVGPPCEPRPDRLEAAPADQSAEGDREDRGDSCTERRDVVPPDACGGPAELLETQCAGNKRPERGEHHDDRRRRRLDTRSEHREGHNEK